jgi:NAD(P)-dependent dehydrogenase (short-subunit alcohol dehydrogenase family)
MSQYWLVTGGNRGIGLALVKQLAARKNVVVFATVRDPSKPGDLEKVVAQHNNVHIIQLRLEVVEDAKHAAGEIAKITDHLDVVIANAGIAYNWERLEKVDVEVAREHLTVNTLGTLILFQAVLPLLRKSGQPKFVPITTQVASMTKPVPYPVSAVALSKVGVNFITQRIHVEHSSEGIIAFPINPGGVKTDIGAFAAPTAFGLKEFTLEAADSARGIISVIDKATEKDSGRFWSYDGEELAW